MNILRAFMQLCIRAYQRVVSPFLPPSCRFEPSCSRYSYEAIETHGPFKGGWLALRRIVKCAPWHPGGYDPVPPRTPSAPAPQE